MSRAPALDLRDRAREIRDHEGARLDDGQMQIPDAELLGGGLLGVAHRVGFVVGQVEDDVDAHLAEHVGDVRRRDLTAAEEPAWTRLGPARRQAPDPRQMREVQDPRRGRRGHQHARRDGGESTSSAKVVEPAAHVR